MPLELINADGTTTTVDRPARIIDGWCIPHPEEVDPTRPLQALALQHARIMKTLFGLHPNPQPNLQRTPAAIDAYVEMLIPLIERKVPIAFTGIAKGWSEPIHPRTIAAWHRKAMIGLLSGPQRHAWPEVMHRAVLAYGRAGYFDPNKTRLPNVPGYASESPLPLAFEANNFHAAAALIELGASYRGYPTKTWVVNTKYVRDFTVLAGDLGAFLDAHCPRGLPGRAAVDQALMECAIKDQRSHSRADLPTMVAAPAQPDLLPPEAVTSAAPVRRRGL